MKEIYKNQYKIVVILVLTLLFQIVGPVAGGFVYADKVVDEAFQIRDITIEDDKAIVDWTFELRSDEEAKTYEHRGDFTLDEGQLGNLIAEDKTVIGEYMVSEDGEMTINIDQKLYEDYPETTSPAALELPQKDIIKVFKGMIGVEGVIGKVDVFNKMEPLGLEPDVPTSVIHTVIAKNEANGTLIQDLDNYRPKIGDKLWLEIQFALEGDHDYGDGSKLVYELPEPLKPAGGSGTLSQDGTSYAKYAIEEGKVVITFNENIRPNDVGIAIQKGYFGITAEFESTDTKLEQELVLPDKDVAGGEIRIPINFQPLGGIKLKKSVDPVNGQNIRELTWTVDVNTVMDDLGPDGKIFKDTLDGNHQYKAGSLIVKRYKIGNNGDIIGSEENVTTEFDQLMEIQQDFSLILTGEYAYEITYITIPGETEDEKQTLKNKA